MYAGGLGDDGAEGSPSGSWVEDAGLGERERDSRPLMLRDGRRVDRASSPTLDACEWARDTDEDEA